MTTEFIRADKVTEGMQTPGGLRIVGIDIMGPLRNITFTGYHEGTETRDVTYIAEQRIEIATEPKREGTPMAQRVNITVESDLSGDEGASTFAFGLDGHGYEIDLTEKEAEKFRKLLAPYVGKARTVRSARKSASKSSGGASPAEVRAWALNNGFEVPARGRIPEAVREAYRAAN